MVCTVKANMTWTTKNNFPIILAKNLKLVLFRNMKGKWNTYYWKCIICAFKFLRQNDLILLRNCALREFQVLRELFFRFIFQCSIFLVKESSKRCLIFSYFTTVFEKSAIISRQQGSNFRSLVALNFPPEYDVMCYYLIFNRPNFLITLIN